MSPRIFPFSPRSRRLLAAALLAATLGASPTPAPLYSPVPNDKSSDVVKRYVAAVAHQNYPAAYALLDDVEKRYFRTAANFATVFTADGAQIHSFKLVGARGRGPERLIFVREDVSVNDPTTGKEHAINAVAAYGALAEVGGWRVRDPGHPWRAYAPGTTVTKNGVRVTFARLRFWDHRIETVFVIANVGDQYVTILPYGRSLLQDSSGGTYHPLITKDWRLTNRQFFLGLRLAPDAEYVGGLAFDSPLLDNVARSWTVTLGPILTDGSDDPFSIDLTAAAPSPAPTQ